MTNSASSETLQQSSSQPVGTSKRALDRTGSGRSRRLDQAGAAGFPCAEMPTEYGGGGGDYRHETVIMEEQLRAGVNGPGSQVHSQIAPYFRHYGTEEQKQRWLPKMASGAMVGAIAMTEPNTGSDHKTFVLLRFVTAMSTLSTG